MRRMRRLRSSAIIRNSIATANVRTDNLIQPLFVKTGKNIKEEITTLPNNYTYSPDTILNEIDELKELGINKFLIFGHADEKDFEGKSAADPNGAVPTALRSINDSFGNSVMTITDVCLCPYTSHGHCGIPDKQGNINNDLSLSPLAEAALTYAEAGADWVAPSDMMDFRIGAIRRKLDENGYQDVGILSYSVKFASAYYGPFRGAIDSSPKFGDRSSYQMDYRTPSQVYEEISSDIKEGADAVMVKPALAYLDIIHRVKEITHVPIAAYNVSGEYSMVKLAASNGIINEGEIVRENFIAMVRAGANWIITYHAKEAIQKGWI